MLREDRGETKGDQPGKLKIELRDTIVTPLLRLIASHFDLLAEDRNRTFLVEAHDQPAPARIVASRETLNRSDCRLAEPQLGNGYDGADCRSFKKVPRIAAA